MQLARIQFRYEGKIEIKNTDNHPSELMESSVMVANIEVGNERLNEAEFSTLIAPIIIRSIRREAEREGRTFKSKNLTKWRPGSESQFRTMLLKTCVRGTDGFPR